MCVGSRMPGSVGGDAAGARGGILVFTSDAETSGAAGEAAVEDRDQSHDLCLITDVWMQESLPGWRRVGFTLEI